MKPRRRDIEVFSMSFLDVVSCGFGAVILLLIISFAFEPVTVERVTEDLRASISSAEGSREELIAQSRELRRELKAKEATLARIRRQFAALEGDWKAARRATVAAEARAEDQLRIEQKLIQVRQSLSAEMRRLLSQPDYRPPGKDAVIGGIPVDSEYIIFVIDTSGSMKQSAWPLVVKKVREVLRAYPRVKGIQVMNDMGRYMYGTYAGKWIPDTPARRKAVVDRLRSWTSFSNSSPVEGIVHAIRRFYRRDRRMSLYVFGDDFTGKSINDAIREVARINKRAGDGVPRVRIHAFGFPVLFLAEKGKANRTRFAHLMRLLAEQNSGSFVGLHSLR
jgi:hypothetical protein